MPVALPQRRQRVFALVDCPRAGDIPSLSALLVALGLDGLYLPSRYEALAEPLSRELRVDVRPVRNRRPLVNPTNRGP